MPTQKDVLVRAKEIISDPARWTTGEYAKDVTGLPTAAIDADAVQWCAIGSLRRAAHDLFLEQDRDLHDKRKQREKKRSWTGALNRAIAKLNQSASEAAPGSGKHSTTAFNDSKGRTHQEVLTLFDDAISRCRG